MRPELLVQTLESVANNAADWSQHHLTLVVDGHEYWMMGKRLPVKELPGQVLINTSDRVGASAARNIGAGSIPKYRRQQHVLFLDDDVYMVNRWDEKLMQLAAACPIDIISGYSHPYNQLELCSLILDDREFNFGRPLVVSSVAMMMAWKTFDDVGPWDEPGGPGGSEDYAICMRAKDRGHDFAVTDPQCVLHTGLMSSTGTAIVGYKELCEQNDKLLDFWNIRGRVVFQ
jgi:GT2 family glycosyltransferase